MILRILNDHEAAKEVQMRKTELGRNATSRLPDSTTSLPPAIQDRNLLFEGLVRHGGALAECFCIVRCSTLKVESSTAENKFYPSGPLAGTLSNAKRRKYTGARPWFALDDQDSF